MSLKILIEQFKSLFSNDKQKDNKALFETNDARKAECPYCNGELKKAPGRKKKCPHCNQFMYVRTRPKDNVRVVVTKEQANKIDEEWSIANGTHDEFLAAKKEYDNMRETLRKRFGSEPSEDSIQWSILNERFVLYGMKQNWWLIRNTKLNMAEHLRKRKRLKEALCLYYEVSYLDLNGVLCITLDEQKDLKGHPQFDTKKSSFLAPLVHDYISKLTKRLGLTHNEAKELFIKHTNNPRLPLSPEKCWEYLIKAG